MEGSTALVFNWHTWGHYPRPSQREALPGKFKEPSPGKFKEPSPGKFKEPSPGKFKEPSPKAKDPQGQKEFFRGATTMQELWERFEKEHLPKRKEKTILHYRQIWAKHIRQAMGAKKVIDVNRDDVHRLHNHMSKHPYQANRVTAMLSKMFNLAEMWGVRPDGINPCRHIEKYRESSRKRYLIPRSINNDPYLYACRAVPWAE